MGFWVGSQDGLLSAIQALREEVAGLKGDRDAIKKQRDYHAEVLTLREQIETLRIEKARVQEEQARKEREVRHEVGLLRKQVETEQDLATKEAVLKVREENLSADRQRFEEQMKFTTARFEKEVQYLHETIAHVLKRLPVVEVEKHIQIGGNGRHREEVEA